MSNSTDFQNSFRIPQDKDQILQILESKLAEPLDKPTLQYWYLYLLKRNEEHKVKQTDREFYQQLRARFEEKLNGGKNTTELQQKPLPLLSSFKQPPAPASIKEVAVVAVKKVKPVLPPLKYSIQFVEHRTHPDGTEVNAGEKFRKWWILINNGEEEVPSGFRIKSFGSNNLYVGELDEKGMIQFKSDERIHKFKSGEKSEVYLFLQAPNAPGCYTDYFQYISPDGRVCGDIFTCTIVVKKETCKPEESILSRNVQLSLKSVDK